MSSPQSTTATRPEPGPVRAPVLRRALLALALFTAACAVAQIVLHDSAIGPYVSVGTAWTVAGLCVLATRLADGLARRGWLWIAAGFVSNAVGDSVFAVLAARPEGAPTVSVADFFYLATYPLLLLGAAIIVRHAAGPRGRESVIDAAAIAIVFGLCSWQFFVVNVGVTAIESPVERAVFTMYPLADALLIAAFAAVLLMPVARTPSQIMLLLGAALLVVADVFYNVVAVQEADHLLPVANAVYDLSYGAMGAAALLVGRAARGRRVDARAGSETARLWLLGLAVAGAPIMAIAAASATSRIHTWAYLAAALGITALVMTRIGSLVQRLRREGEMLRRAESELEHRATHDPLTGLANRTLLLSETRAAMETGPSGTTGERLHLLFVDLDDFKIVNDSLGHRRGDELLQRVGEITRDRVDPHHLVARLGGDEFVVLARSISTAAAERLATDIIATLSAPIGLDRGMNVVVGASVGIAAFDGHADPVEILRDADVAMYEAKQLGKGRARVFDTIMSRRAEERHAMETGLRHALDSGVGLRLDYEARVDLESGLIVGFEALARWTDAHGVAHPPSAFIPVAEATGLILPLGAWALDRACADLARLNAARDPADPLTMAINVSVRQVEATNLGATVASALARHRVPAELVTLEITESVLATDPERVATVLEEIRVLGVRLEVDDFGVGYSSLSRLGGFPLDGVKIDRGFVAELATSDVASLVVSTTLALAGALGLTATAEGVETRAQVDWLLENGCRFGQGFLFHRPLPFEDLAQLFPDDQPAIGAEVPASGSP